MQLTSVVVSSACCKTTHADCIEISPSGSQRSGVCFTRMHKMIPGLPPTTSIRLPERTSATQRCNNSLLAFQRSRRAKLKLSTVPALLSLRLLPITKKTRQLCAAALPICARKEPTGQALNPGRAVNEGACWSWPSPSLCLTSPHSLDFCLLLLCVNRGRTRYPNPRLLPEKG